MTRVVVCTEERLAADLAAELGRRGFDVRRVADTATDEDTAAGGAYAISLAICADDCHESQQCPHDHGAATEPTVVLVGRPPATCALLRAGCVHYDNLDDAAELRTLVEAHRAGDPTAPDVVPKPADDGELVEYLHHEIRTPLTAIQSALEILTCTTAAAERGPSPTRLLEIVRANLRRLDRSVAWSEEWHRLRTQGIPRQRSLWHLEELPRLAAESPTAARPPLTWTLDAATAEHAVIANRAGVGLLVRQIAQALSRYAPAVEFQIQVALSPAPSPGTERHAQLALTWLPSGEPAAELQLGRVVRTRSVCRRQPPHAELDHLIALVVDRRLVAELQAQITICTAWGPGRAAVSVALPVTLPQTEPSAAGVC